MATGIFVCAWLILWFAPETWLGRFLHHWMLAGPITRVSRITRGEVLLGLTLLTTAAILLSLLHADGIRLLAAALPEVGIWVTAFEATTWLETITSVALLSVSARLIVLTRLLRRPGHRRRPRRGPARPSCRAAANDDERPGRKISAA